jgi:hypothetical protein
MDYQRIKKRAQEKMKNKRTERKCNKFPYVLVAFLKMYANLNQTLTGYINVVSGLQLHLSKRNVLS